MSENYYAKLSKINEKKNEKLFTAILEKEEL